MSYYTDMKNEEIYKLVEKQETVLKEAVEIKLIK